MTNVFIKLRLTLVFSLDRIWVFSKGTIRIPEKGVFWAITCSFLPTFCAYLAKFSNKRDSCLNKPVLTSYLITRLYQLYHQYMFTKKNDFFIAYVIEEEKNLFFRLLRYTRSPTIPSVKRGTSTVIQFFTDVLMRINLPQQRFYQQNILRCVRSLTTTGCLL